MGSRPLLIDTSAFIEFSRNGDSAVAAAVDEALAQGCAAVCEVIAAELLSGCRSKAEYRQMMLVLGGMIRLPMRTDCWSRAAALGYNLRRRGVTMPLTDRLIVVTARAHGAELLHQDAHFDLVGDTPDTAP